MAMFEVGDMSNVWAAVKAAEGTVVADIETTEEVHETVEEANMVAGRLTSFVSGARDRFVDRFRKRRRSVGASTHRPPGRQE